VVTVNGPETSTSALRRDRSEAPHHLLRGPGLSGGATLGADRRPDAVPEGGSQCPRMFEEAVDGGVSGEACNEGAAGLRVLLASLEERLQHRKVRDQVNEGMTGEVLAGALVPELPLVA
jgi:hypothetical protein